MGDGGRRLSEAHRTASLMCLGLGVGLIKRSCPKQGGVWGYRHLMKLSSDFHTYTWHVCIFLHTHGRVSGQPARHIHTQTERSLKIYTAFAVFCSDICSVMLCEVAPQSITLCGGVHMFTHVLPVCMCRSQTSVAFLWLST